MDDRFILFGLSVHVHGLRVLQREHKLFLDVKEDRVTYKYLWTYAQGTSSLDVFISDM